MSEKQTIHAFISGRVQGVWFRDGCRQEATKLGVCGWVKNCDDGRVELKATADPKAMEKFQVWLAKGPLLAKVRYVDVEEIPPEAFESFVIKR